MKGYPNWPNRPKSLSERGYRKFMAKQKKVTVNGEESSAMISGIAGLGHIFITIALAIFVTALGRSIKTVEA